LLQGIGHAKALRWAEQLVPAGATDSVSTPGLRPCLHAAPATHHSPATSQASWHSKASIAMTQWQCPQRQPNTGPRQAERPVHTPFVPALAAGPAAPAQAKRGREAVLTMWAHATDQQTPESVLSMPTKRMCTVAATAAGSRRIGRWSIIGQQLGLAASIDAQVCSLTL
jgi:hypothetical protein